MQIDGMIATVLKQEPADSRSCVAAWRQLSDILAQRGNQLAQDDIRRALHALAILRPRVAESDRRASAAAIAKHGRFAPLVAFYAGDSPAVAAAILRPVQLSEEDWLALLPATTPGARAILGLRNDLPIAVQRALASLGARSVALPHPANVPSAGNDSAPASVAAASQISELVRRIDKYRAGQSSDPAPLYRDTFLFETGPDGIIHWAEGISRGAVIGLSIAEAAYGGEPGTDGVAAGAFRQRAEMINARIVIEGGSSDGGEWRFSALPWFDGASGQFRGYRGSARRPNRNEVPFGTAPAQDAGDSIRQLIHELRSPLNAISGFAQIIAGQMFGPVNQAYRQMAETIVGDAAHVQTVIEDLETAARSDAATDPGIGDETSDLALILAQVERELEPLIVEQSAQLVLSRADGPFLTHLSASQGRRMIGRLLTAIVDITAQQEQVVGQLILDAAAPDNLLLRIDRPAAIQFATEAELLDPGYSPNGDAPGAAILSLGFSLRLVASLARAAGGSLEIGTNALTLRLCSANSVVTEERSIAGKD